MRSSMSSISAKLTAAISWAQSQLASRLFAAVCADSLTLPAIAVTSTVSKTVVHSTIIMTEPACLEVLCIQITTRYSS